MMTAPPHPFNMGILLSTLQPILLFKSTENAAFRYELGYNVAQPAFCRITVKLALRRGQAVLLLLRTDVRSDGDVFLCAKQVIAISECPLGHRACF